MTAPQQEMALYSLFDVTFPRVRGTVCSVEFLEKVQAALRRCTKF